MTEKRSVSEWLNGYAAAWESADPRAAAELFTVDAGYRSHIMSTAHVGTDGIAEYWRRATSSQSDVEVQFREPLADGDRVVVEWWTQMTDEGADETLPGVLLLRFSGDLCSWLREYWHSGDARVGPYPGWGEVIDGDHNSTKASVRRWARGYDAAWRSLDPEAAAALYADEVVYRSHPLRPPDVGRAGVLEYSRRAFGSEADPDPVFGEPVVSGSCAAVEYWTTLVEEGREATLAGCCVLTIAHDGLVEGAREYWFVEDGRREPPPEWGWR